MLTVLVPLEESFDEESATFTVVSVFKLELEHSLAALSKWEEIHEKPYLTKDEKTPEEILSYIQCMALGPDVPPEVFDKLTKENVEEIFAYMQSKRTATWFSNQQNSGRSQEILTAELIYYWMFTLGIPLEFENRHLSKLFTVIGVFGAKNAKPRKMSRSEIAARNREINARRKAELGTRG
jgi:hypothetical protein